MKLYIAENLKRLRQGCGLTQEQLAERLGVSFQSVSRWETGLSYPDIEMIPEIAAFFEVSTDVLMGVEKATMEQNLARDKKILRMDEFETMEERLAFIEELHRKYPHDAEILVDLVYALSGYRERSEEMRGHIREYLSHPDAEKAYIDQLVCLLVASEKEESLTAVLDRYAVEYDMSRAALLACRAGGRSDRDACRRYRHYNTLELIYRLLDKIPAGNGLWFNYSPDAERAVRRKLSLLNHLTGMEGERMDFITGDGEPDLWYSVRLACGFQLAGNYAMAGKTEEAFDAIDSVVRLAEKFYSMPEGTVLTYRCPELSELRETFRYGVRNPDDVHDFSENLHRCMRSDETFSGVDLMYERRNGDGEFDHHVECAAWDIVPLTDTEEWACFDSIRGDARFKAYIERMRKFIIPVSKEA